MDGREDDVTEEMTRRTERLIEIARAMLPRLQQIAEDGDISAAEFPVVLSSALGMFTAAIAVQTGKSFEEAKEILDAFADVSKVTCQVAMSRARLRGM